MVKRLTALVFIFVFSSIAWSILGAQIDGRTHNSANELRGRVQSVWGTVQSQPAPLAEFAVPVKYSEAVTEDGKQRIVEKTRLDTFSVRPAASDIQVDLENEPRQKGLLWYSTYKVNFRGAYRFTNPDKEAHNFKLNLRFPSEKAIYDGLTFSLDGRAAATTAASTGASTTIDLAPGQSVKLDVTYRSQGLESWRYSFGGEVNPVQNFHLKMNTNFKDIDFPENTLAPGEKVETVNGWRLDWNYKSLLSGYDIAMTMPEKLQPGPLASQISFFAPVSLFFFFFLMFIITTLRDIDLHPMNYFFLSAAFFAFHLLLAYLVDHLDIHLSFLIASAVSILLVVSYLRLVVGTQFAAREAALAQLIYLVLFSYAFFFKGFTGLAITIGSVLTLFIVMQMTGRIKWSDKFATPRLTPDRLRVEAQ